MTGFANTSRVQLRYAKESSFGVAPGTGTTKNLRFTGESLDANLTKQTSKEIRADRQISDLVVVNEAAQGGINFELSYNEYDELLASALQNTWAVFGTNGVTTPASATFSTDTITFAAAPTGNDVLTALAVGQHVKVGGANIAANDVLAPVVAVTATTVQFPPNTFTADATANTSVTLSSSRLTNGTVQDSYAIEKSLTDVGQIFTLLGMTLSKLNLSYSSGNMVTGSFDFMGKNETRGTVTQLPGAPAASHTYAVMNAVKGVGNMTEGGAALTTFIKSLTLALDNKLRARDAIGNLGAVSIGSGTIELKGNLQAYFSDGNLYDKAIANTVTSLSFSSLDDAGNGYVFTLPAVKYDSPKVVAGAIDQDCMLDLAYQAIMDAVSGKMIFIDRVGVAVS